MGLPVAFINNMREILGEEGLGEYLDSFEKPKFTGLRVNTSKISVEEFLRISPFKLRRVPWTENGFYYTEEDSPTHHPYYYAGLYYIQEPSAMAPAAVLPVERGERVLDLCAAPGGKATELGAKLNHTGLLVANDASASRTKALLKNLEVFGIPNLLVTSEMGDRLDRYFHEYFDKILIDAPCSGEGMFRKQAHMIPAWEKQGPEVFANMQREILRQAAELLKPGGTMLYSTCTFSKLENEGSIDGFLAEHQEFTLEEIPRQEGFCSGMPAGEMRPAVPSQDRWGRPFPGSSEKSGREDPGRAGTCRQTRQDSRGAGSFFTGCIDAHGTVQDCGQRHKSISDAGRSGTVPRASVPAFRTVSGRAFEETLRAQPGIRHGAEKRRIRFGD